MLLLQIKELEAALAELRRENERLTEMFTAHDNALTAKLQQNATLRDQLAALQWTPITLENLPKVGDEVWGEENDVQPVYRAKDYAHWFEFGYTHFRPKNPPTGGAQ